MIEMRITGGKSYVKFDLENGYILKAEGEMLINRVFVAYKNSMKNWEYPHEDEGVSENQIDEIIKQVKENTNENTIQIEFE